MNLHRGIGLIDVVLALALVGALAGLGVPALHTLVLETRMTTAVNDLVHAVHAARTLAHSADVEAVVCRSTGAAQCTGVGDWAAGWIVFVNADGDDPPRVDDGERIVTWQEKATNLKATSNRAAYVLRPWSLRATNGSVIFCDARGATAARAVIVSTTGRPRVARRTAAGKPLTCPP